MMQPKKHGSFVASAAAIKPFFFTLKLTFLTLLNHKNKLESRLEIFYFFAMIDRQSTYPRSTNQIVDIFPDEQFNQLINK